MVNNSIVRVASIRDNPETLLCGLSRKEWYLPEVKGMSEKRSCEWLAARVLLKEMLNEEKEIRYTALGKPYLVDNSFFISISHTKGFVAVAADKEKPVAVDIEQISPRVENLYTRFMNEKEIVSVSQSNRLIHLLLHWSAKESLFKLMDKNDIDFRQQLHLDPFEPTLGKWAELTAKETRTALFQGFAVRYFVSEDYVLTLCNTIY